MFYHAVWGLVALVSIVALWDGFRRWNSRYAYDQTKNIRGKIEVVSHAHNETRQRVVLLENWRDGAAGQIRMPLPPRLKG